MAPRSALVRDAHDGGPAGGSADLDAVVGERRPGGEPDRRAEHGDEERDPSHDDPLVSSGRRSHQVSRTSEPRVTPDFQATWREIEPVLQAAIRRWGIDAHAAADLAQDVAERAWRRGVGFDDAGDLLRWCRVVARNLIVDRYRRSGREVLSAADTGCSESAEDVVVSRLEVEQLVAAFSRLQASEQQAIMGRTSSPATPAERVRRHRARERFARAIAAASAVAGWLGVRRWRAPAAAIAVTPSLIFVIALSGANPFGSSGSRPLSSQGVHRAASAATRVVDAQREHDVPRRPTPRGAVVGPRVLPERRVDVPLPTGERQSVRTYHVPADEPTVC
ncbi:MAG: Sigma-70 region 2, partial [Actinomycetota bacterium]|nr:Sigma-70 region 2 [Actinomycetota bacterium]